jgi:class 3 adenylate cyclase
VRYLKATLLIGLLTSVVVAALYEAGIFARLDATLAAFLGKTALPDSNRLIAQYAAVICLAFGIAWTTIDITKISLKCLIAAAALVEILAATWVLNLYEIWFSPFPSATAICLSFALGLGYACSGAGRRKRIVRQLFGERLSRKSFYALVNSDLPLDFKGEMRDATVVSCELFNHDELMDSLETADYVTMTNLFLNTSANYLVEKGGYLDECDGEALRVIFGAPLEDPRHAATATEATLELVTKLHRINRECEAKWGKMFDFRIGINSGEIVTAAYGSGRLGSFSVSGDQVEFARRLCAANTVYGTRILIGSHTYALAHDAIEVRPIELLRGADERSREEVYELLAVKNGLSEEEQQRRELFWKGIVYYREQQWDHALQHLYASLSFNGSDGPVELYIRRIDSIRSGSLDWETARF